MLNRRQLSEILTKVSKLTSSGQLICKPDKSIRLPWIAYKQHRETKKAIQILHKKYPQQKLNVRRNLLQHFAVLYSEIREAQKNNDAVLMHKYLSAQLYQKWRKKQIYISQTQQLEQNRNIAQKQLRQPTQVSQNLVTQNKMLDMFDFVADIKIKKAKVFETKINEIQAKNEWFQCQITTAHTNIKTGSKIIKNHVIERKLNLQVFSERKWYFCYFQN